MNLGPDGAAAALSSFYTSCATHIRLTHPGDDDAHINDDSRQRRLHEFINTFQNSIKNPRQRGITMATSIIMESVLESTSVMLERLINQHRSIKIRSFHDTNGLMERRLRQDGWCPSEISRLHGQFNTSCLYFIYQSPRQRPTEIHNDKSTQASHLSTSASVLCTPFVCANKQLSDTTYQTKHANDDCDCQDMVAANPDELCEILEQGKIPLILLMEENDSYPNIMFVGCDPRETNLQPYVAISHVWSDGLGNTKENSLPRCQLRRLSEFVKELPGQYSDTLLFWCDTICVPTDMAAQSSKRMKNAQTIAMTLMRDVYAKAMTVLVLDSWLWNNSTEDKSDTEILMEIFTCPWNTRLWTYQEGALPESLHFQFSDQAYNLDAGMAEANKSKNAIERLTLLAPIRVRYQSLRGFREKQTAGQRLAVIATELGHRMTSVAADESLCLAVLLDLDVEKIVNTEDDLRIQELWRMMPTVPRHLVFTTLATLDVKGLRWAPKTFLKSPLNVSMHGNPTVEGWPSSGDFAAQTMYGIHLKEIGILFQFGSGRFTSPFFLRDQDLRYYTISFGNDLGQKKLGQVGYDMSDRAGSFQSLAVILNCSSNDFEGDYSAGWTMTDTSDSFEFIAALVGIIKVEGGVIHCQRIQRCVVTRYSEDTSNGEIRYFRENILPVEWRYGMGMSDRQYRYYAADGKILQEQDWYVG
ncbi:hypothetical protein GGS26DRAFT_577265 [Hypomontagnella submonticulosa]|nr:hypothetical protein GGS26DRAFT_577265 [Hypomontagnella submonticulosa]